jgi:hypothetical protein
MDGMNNLGASADPKSAVMNQVRQEAAMQNAKLLIDVHSYSNIPLHPKLSNEKKTENKRTLLRKMRPQTRLLPLIRRDDMFYAVHGEVYGGLEYGVEAVYWEGTTGDGEGCWGWGWGYVIGVLAGEEGIVWEGG